MAVLKRKSRAPHHKATRSMPTTPSATPRLDKLPAEIFDAILAHLTHPRSRLPGLTEEQSRHDFPHQERRRIKAQEDLATPPDTQRDFANLFSNLGSHPFNALAATSKDSRDKVESYCKHLVKINNKFNLPFAAIEQDGPDGVYPNLSGIVYRRLWLQTADRFCVFCSLLLGSYSHLGHQCGVLAMCEECFYNQSIVRLVDLKWLSSSS